MTRWIVLFLMSLWPAVVLSQTVTVRSGEHGDFTRLVLTIPSGTNWEVSPDRVRRRLELMLDGGPLEFDTSTVFNRIDTNRIAELVALHDGRGLAIQLACDCDADVFVLGDTMLVVDIAPGTEIPSVEAIEPQQTLSDSEVALSPLFQDFFEVRVGVEPGIGPSPVRDPLLAFLPVRVEESGVAPAEDFAPNVVPRSAEGLGSRIATDLAVAATHGLLDPALGQTAIKPAANPSAPDPLVSGEPDARAENLARDLAVGLSGLDADSFVDGRLSIGGDACVPGESLALAAWAKPDSNPSKVLAQRRSEVFGEFDRIAPNALERYVQALLYYGFGAEARSAMSLYAEPESPIHLALSYIVDGEEDSSRRFKNQMNCEGPASLWSVLSSTPHQSAPEINHASVLRTFEALPKHLRTHLGPMLAQKLSNFGATQSASDVLRRLERMEGEETDSISLGKALIALKKGDHDGAEKRLHDLSVAGGPEAADAVAAAIDLANANDTPVSARIVDLSEAFAVELRNSEDGEKLWQAHVTSLLVNRSFDAAFDELEARDGTSAELIDAMKEAALGALVTNAGDVGFLKIATRLLGEGVYPEADSLSIAFAERFLDLGLAEVALQQLDALPKWDSHSEARVTRAKALLALSQPEEAEIILIGQQSDEVTRLRAEARHQMGDHVFAKTLFEGVGEAGAAVNSAWLSGEWEEVADSESALADAADLMLQGPEELEPTQVSLGSADAISAASALSRETLRALLDATAIPESE
jgi:hypothetical protein